MRLIVPPVPIAICEHANTNKREQYNKYGGEAELRYLAQPQVNNNTVDNDRTGQA